MVKHVNAVDDDFKIKGHMDKQQDVGELLTYIIDNSFIKDFVNFNETITSECFTETEEEIEGLGFETKTNKYTLLKIVSEYLTVAKETKKTIPDGVLDTIEIISELQNCNIHSPSDTDKEDTLVSPTNIAKQHTVYSNFNDFIIVQAVRYSNTGANTSKIPHDKVTSTFQLQFTENGTKYNLIAMIFHIGTDMNSGHYIAKVKLKSGVWYEVNDGVVEEITGTGNHDNIMKNAAGVEESPYFLLYIKDDLEQDLDVATPKGIANTGNSCYYNSVMNLLCL